jgi:acyl-ACP thioesterase
MLLYEKNYQLRVSDFDQNDSLRPSAMLDMFQSVASEHATKLNIGYSDLLQKDSVWVLLRMRYDVIRRVGFGVENVIVKTWPQVAGKVDYDRDYCIESLDGERLVKASSKWCVINMQTRRIAVGNAIYPEGEHYSEVIYPEGLKKLPTFELDGASVYEGYAGHSCLDHNGHVNNVKYNDFILDALKLEKGEIIKVFEINYVNEMQVGNFALYVKKDGNKRLIRGFSNEKEAFRAVVELF